MTASAPDWGRVIESVALEVLGEPPRRNGHELRYGTNGSLVVTISGPYAGRWKSWKGPTGGKVLAFLEWKLGLDRQEARRWLQDRQLVSTRPSAQRVPANHRQTPAGSQVHSPEPGAKRKQGESQNLRIFARRLWSVSEQIPTSPDHPARRWMANRHLWRLEFPLPSCVRWIPPTTSLFRGLHQGAGSIAVLMAPPSAWQAAWPQPPELAAIHLVSIDAAGMPALDRPGEYIDKKGNPRPGLGKRLYGSTTGTVAILGHPVVKESTAPTRVIEGLADGLAISARFEGAVIAGIGTPARLAKDEDFIDWLTTSPHGVVIHADADEPGQNAARALRRALKDANIYVRAVLPPEGAGKDAADVSRRSPFPPLPEAWTDYASTLQKMHPTWPRWEVARQATIAAEGDHI